jgi:AcrR family transcriptional regulator
MSSHLSTDRRVPRQERSERRVAQILDAAAAVFAEVGYEAATMTAIAQRAQASSGAAYQYFPNKEALVRALRKSYGDAITALWSDLEMRAPQLSIKQIAHCFIDTMVDFVEARPAYFVVLDAPVQYQRDPEARYRLRSHLAEIFRARKPGLTTARAYRIANVALQIVKSMNPLYAPADGEERAGLVTEYKVALTAYLETQLGQ